MPTAMYRCRRSGVLTWMLWYDTRVRVPYHSIHVGTPLHSSAVAYRLRLYATSLATASLGDAVANDAVGSV